MPGMLDQEADKEVRFNSSQNTGDASQVAGARTSVPRPQVSEQIRSWTKNLWQETDEPENWKAATGAAEYCRNTLFPGWYDPRDPAKGRMHTSIRQRKDDRRVRNPITFINLQQSLAMLIPEGTKSCTEPIEGVDSEDVNGDPIQISPTLMRFAKSLDVVTAAYQEEAGWDGIRKMFVRDALAFPIAWLKIYFSRSWADGPIGRSDTDDEQGNLARIQAIQQRILDGEIYQGDPEWQELQLLVQGIGGKSELVLNQELVIERLDMEDVKVPDSCRRTEDILRSPWISQEFPTMTVAELRDRYPFTMNEDGTWTGIHPDDLKSLSGNTGNDNATAAGRMKKNPHTSNNQGVANGEKRMVRVREVHSRENNTISVLIEGLDYPAHQWTPKRTPKQWYMFVPCVLNEVPGSCFGFSDVEMGAESQHRINRKLSDAEKNRWLAMRRYVRDTSVGEPSDQLKNLADTPPGSSVGMNLGGKDINTMLFPVETPYVAEAFNIAEDEKYGQMANRLPIQSLGVTGGGSADFSSEVDVAAAGANLSIKDRQAVVKKALSAAERLMREILLQELSWDDAAEVSNPSVVWPHVYGDAEAKQMGMEITSAVRQQMAPQVMQAYQQDPMLFVGASPADRVSEMLEAIDRVAAPVVEDECLKRFGFPEPMSREAMFKRLRCVTETTMTSDMDANKKRAGITQALSSAAELKGAMAAAGQPMNMRPILRVLLPDHANELHGAFPDDPNAAIRTAAQLIQSKPNDVDPQLLQQVSILVAQLLQKSGVIPGPPGAGPGGGAPPQQQPGQPAPAAQPAQPPAPAAA